MMITHETREYGRTSAGDVFPEFTAEVAICQREVIPDFDGRPLRFRWRRDDREWPGECWLD